MSVATTDVAVCTNVCIARKSDAAKLPQVATPGYYEQNVRVETQLAYALLAKLLWDDMGVRYNASEIIVSKKGKPQHRSRSYYFSYAHTKDFVACAVSEHDVGLDLEQSRVIPAKLHHKFLTPKEIQAQVDPLHAWVVKEAYSKLVGEGLGLGFSNYSAYDLLDKTCHLIHQQDDYVLAVFCGNLTEFSVSEL